MKYHTCTAGTSQVPMETHLLIYRLIYSFCTSCLRYCYAWYYFSGCELSQSSFYRHPHAPSFSLESSVNKDWCLMQKLLICLYPARVEVLKEECSLRLYLPDTGGLHGTSFRLSCPLLYRTVGTVSRTLITIYLHNTIHLKCIEVYKHPFPKKISHFRDRILCKCLLLSLSVIAFYLNFILF